MKLSYLRSKWSRHIQGDIREEISNDGIVLETTHTTLVNLFWEK